VVCRYLGVNGLFWKRWLEKPVHTLFKEVCTSSGKISVLQKAYENEVGLFLTPSKTSHSIVSVFMLKDLSCYKHEQLRAKLGG